MLRGCQDVTINGENRAVGESGIELERHAVISVGVVKFALGYVEDELIVTNVTDAQTKQDAPVVTAQSTSWKRTALIAVLCSAIPSAMFAGMWYSQANGNDSEVVAEA
ncbi:EscD/YscD/HrpQ family type III secretion system inner membrane ring protein, partial [Vibrio parahaemolyticus]